MQATHLKGSESARSVSSELQNMVNKKIIKIIKKAIKHPKTPDKKIVAQFVGSLVLKNSKKNTEKTLQRILNQIDCITSADDVIKVIGKNAFKAACNIITISNSPEEEDSKHLRIFISTAITGLPDKTYYKSAEPANRAIFKYYKQLLETLGNHFNFKGLGEFAEIEREYIDILDEAEDEPTVTLTGSQLESKFKHINWTLFWDQFDIPKSKWHAQHFVVYSQKWLAHVNSMLTHFSLDKWRLILRAMLILCYGRFLPDNLNKHFFYLYQYMLNGQKRRTNYSGEILYYAKKYLEIPLSRLYIDETDNAAFREKIKKFVQSIQEGTIKRIKETDWLTEKSRAAAIKKVEKINLGILYPTKPYNYDVPALTKDVIANVQLIGKSLIQKALKDVENKFTTDLWDGLAVYNVNAYYSSSGNRLYIPSAIVNWPFYCEQASAGWNYGSLGCVIGHEITHAFDDNGKDYDPDGNKKEWWTAHDKREYEKKTDAISEFYKRSKLYGKHIDVEDTLGENIADLGGLGSSLEALKTYLNAANVSDEERRQNYHDFFSAYATSWREKERRAHGLRELIVDVHSPAIARVNNIVCHFQEWYDTFGICTSDPLYVPVEKRLRIF